MSADPARRSDAREQLPPCVATVLAAAEIPPSKLGRARRARLSENERELYFWILRRFATSDRPSNAELRAMAAQLGLDAEQALDTLEREDLVHLGRDQETAVARTRNGGLDA